MVPLTAKVAVVNDTDLTPDDRDEAREHLRMVNSILDRAGRSARPFPSTYVAWGLTGTLFNLAYAQSLSAFSTQLAIAGEAMTVIAYILTAVEFVRAQRTRTTLLDRQAILLFAGITTVLWVLKWIWFSNNVVDGVAFSFMWSLGFAIALIIYGAGPMRPLFVGGCILIAGVFAASFMPGWMPLILAIANFAGVAGPGVYFAIKRSE